MLYPLYNPMISNLSDLLARKSVAQGALTSPFVPNLACISYCKLNKYWIFQALGSGIPWNDIQKTD